MRAVVFHGIGDIRLDDVPEPKIQGSTDAEGSRGSRCHHWLWLLLLLPQWLLCLVRRYQS